MVFPVHLSSHMFIASLVSVLLLPLVKGRDEGVLYLLPRAFCLYSLDYLICPREELGRKCQTDLFRRLQVNDEFKLRRLLDRQVSRPRPLLNLVHVVGGLAEQVIIVRSIGHEAALIDKLLLEVNGWQPVFTGKLDDLLSFGEKTGTGDRHNPANLLLLCGSEGAL